MNVVMIRNGESPGERRASGKEFVLEAVQFIVGAALTLLAPTLFYCAVTGQALPLYVMASNDVLGAVLGLLMFKRSSGGPPSCVPATRLPRARSAPSDLRLKDAA